MPLSATEIRQRYRAAFRRHSGARCRKMVQTRQRTIPDLLPAWCGAGGIHPRFSRGNGRRHFDG